MTDIDRDKALKQAYSKATSIIRKRHQEEFNAEYKAAGAALGVEVSLRPNAEEKAREKIKELLAANPDLATEFGVAINPAWSDDPAE